MMHQLPAMFPGARFCKVMQASVDSILAPLGIRRRVISRGREFLNIDAWTGLHFVGHLFDHFAKSPTKIPDREELRRILEKTNSAKEPDPRIVVAAMPKDPSPQMVLAIVGGGYHEAWHTKYTKRSIVTIAEAHAMLDEAREVLRAGGVFDAKLRGLVRTLHHLIEDVRIERRGNEEFPGAFQAMCDLQDFILDLEQQGRDEGSIIRGVEVSKNARSIMLSCFRDLGLGYDTDRAREALEFYKKASPRAVALLAPGGLLEPMLREAQGLSRDDAMGSLRLAFQTAALLCRASRQKASDPPLACPSCGAHAKNLVVRAMKDTEGHKLRGRAEVECRICGAKSETQLPDSSLDLLQEDPAKEDDRPEVDDLDENDVGEGLDGFGYDASERRRNGRGEEKLPENVVLILGGRASPEEPTDPVVAIALDVVGGDGGDGLLNHASALQLIVGLLHQQEERQLLDGEMSWCPADPSADVAEMVTSANRNSDADTTSAMLREVSREVSYMRAKFRTTFRAQEMTDVLHGERRGRRISERMLVDARIDLLSGTMPSRPYVGHSEQVETSLALAVCLDQSGSMSDLRRDMQKCCLLMTDPVDKVGGATFAFGFRDNRQAGFFNSDESDDVHRSHAVRYDVFKRWDERLDGAKWRFANTLATGMTPMADGVQFGLSALNERSEAHRFLVVLTDGRPDSPHEKVIRRQLRIAEEAGIHVLGVGVGREARYVKQLFPKSAWAETVSQLPPILIEKLHEMCDFSGRRRGRRAQLDGPVSRMAK